VLRLLFRLTGLISLAGAFAAAVIDAARTLANGRLEWTPAGVTLDRLFPAKFEALPALAARIHPKLWDPVLLTILWSPTALILAVVGLLLLALARPRREPSPIGARR